MQYYNENTDINQLERFDNMIARQDFFNNIISNQSLDGLHIEWYVTFDKNNQDLPAYVEAVIFQRYFEIYGELPEWNEKF